METGIGTGVATAAQTGKALLCDGRAWDVMVWRRMQTGARGQNAIQAKSTPRVHVVARLECRQAPVAGTRALARRGASFLGGFGAARADAWAVDAGSARGRADPNEASSSRGAWLRPHIRVRIVDKGLKSGKYYLKKCRVVDVVGRGVCTVLVEDDRRLLEDVSYKMLETVLPKTGGRVMIVGGSKELCGRRGCLVHKNKDTEEASVQLAGQDLRIETVSMDHIAEFVGEAEDLLED